MTPESPHTPAPTRAQADPGPDGATVTRTPDAAAGAPTRAQADGPEPPCPGNLPRVPGYDILQELGRGGMGVVYLARDCNLNRTVALKMVLHGAVAGSAARARFLAEAEALAALQHPHVVQVFGRGEWDGAPFYAMEFCPGGALAARVKEAPLPPADAARAVECLARGMQAAHALGILHRDLKPENVLYAADGTPKLTDFGLAKRTDESGASGPSLTTTGAIMGTPSYMAPEQARGDTKHVGPAADVWALGAVLYRLVAGRPPFLGANPAETIRQVVETEPLSPTQLTPGLPRDLATICLKCLQKEPGQRYPSAAALADDLHRFLNGQPILARPVGRLERVWRWAKRNPWDAALTGTLFGVVLVALFGMTALWRRAADRARDAREQQTVADANRARAVASETQVRELLVAADAEKARAQGGERQAKAVAALLGGLFEAPDPLQARGYTAPVRHLHGDQLTARDMLLRGAARLSKRTDLDDATRADLLERVGNTLIAVGEAREAVKLLEEARDILIRLHGPDHLDLAPIYHSLAWIDYVRGRPAESGANYRAALELMKKRPPTPEAELERSAVTFKYALLLAEMEDHHAARAAAKEALDIRKGLLEAADPYDLRLGEAYFGYAVVAMEDGKRAEAMQAAQSAMAVFRRRAAEDPLARAIALFYDGVVLADVLSSQGAAEGKLREALTLVRAELGPRHLYSAMILGQLALTLYRGKKSAEAEQAFLECLEIARQQHLLTHPKAAELFGPLCELLSAGGKGPQARAIADEWLAAHRAVNPTGVTYADALTVASEAWARAGDTAKELAMLEEAHRLYHAGPEPVRRRWAVVNLGRLGEAHMRGGRWAAAEPVLREWVTRLKDKDPVPAAELGKATALLSRSGARQGKYPPELEADLSAARKALTPALPLARPPAELSMVEAALSEHYRGRSEVKKAVPAARAAAKAARTAEQHLDAATELALCAAAGAGDAKALGDEVVTALGKAAAAGYRDADAVAGMDAFRPLVDRPAFQDVLKKMREGKPPQPAKEP